MSLIEGGDRLGYTDELIIGQFSIDGKGQDVFGRSFGYREGSLLIAEVPVTGLQMHGHGIVNFGAYSVVFQICPQFVSLLYAHSKLIEHMLITLCSSRQYDVIADIGILE
jgi:hypothetical protein